MFTFFVLLLLLILWISSNNKLKKLQAEVDALKEGLLSTEVAIKGNQQTLGKANHSTESSVLPNILSTTEDINEDTLSYSDLEPTIPPLDVSTEMITTAVNPSENLESYIETDFENDVEAYVSEHTVTSRVSKTETESSLLIAQNDQSVVFANHSNNNIADINTDTTHPIDDDLPDSPPVLLAEPDEKSISIVTSTANSFKNWFMGGNLVVRVGAIVLLMGVVLLLRLVSEYIEIPIEMKLAAIGFAGLAVAALGIKLFKKRASYGMTLQGSGLATAYLTAFFAYDVYHVLPSLPSFIILAVLSASTVALAVRQNAFPLALLAFSGAFIAPLLTNTEEGSLTTLFSYYLVLNIAIAVIAHYRTWKVLNALGATVTFGFAYYLGYLAPNSFENNIDILSQRWSLVTLVALQWLLYVFIVVRYAQQISAYNLSVSKPFLATNSVDVDTVDSNTINSNNFSSVNTDSIDASHVDTSNVDTKQTAIDEIFPIDISLMFSVPLLVFGLFFGLLNDINNGLTTASAMMALVYLVLGFFFIRHNIDKRHDLIIEGMLALGFGFTALTIALAFDAQWAAIGWTAQGLALVWFGRRSLRHWLIAAGLGLQVLAIFSLLAYWQQWFDVMVQTEPSNLALTASAIAWMAAMFMLRSTKLSLFDNAAKLYHSNNKSSKTKPSSAKLKTASRRTGSKKRTVTKPSFSEATLASVWHETGTIHVLTFIGMLWGLFVIQHLLFENLMGYDYNMLSLLTLVVLFNLAIYWVVDHFKTWHEVVVFNKGLLCVFYLLLLLLIPEHYEFGFSLFANRNQLLVIFMIAAGLFIGQLWIKRWLQDEPSVPLHNTLWLSTLVILITELIYYRTQHANGLLIVLIISLIFIALIHFNQYLNSPALQQKHQHRKTSQRYKGLPPPWYNWNGAIEKNSLFVLPIALIWVIVSNWTQRGTVWGLPYIPLLNLFDITVLVVFAYLYRFYKLFGRNTPTAQSRQPLKTRISSNSTIDSLLLPATGIIGFWFISSILIRTLHAYAGTPLWFDGAIMNDKVKICLTIFWSVMFLLAAYKLPRLPSSFDWHKTLITSSAVVIPVMLFWIIVSNWYYEGVVWQLPYIPLLNLYDIAILLALAYGLKIHQLASVYTGYVDNDYFEFYKGFLLKALGIIGFWVLSSILIRTMHAYVDTPLWAEGAWFNDQVQTALTILWTLTALVATIIASRSQRRFWWFMGIGLLGLVVVKLVLVDLSQTEAIWRVISFLGAGSLILLIGYLAPLPPEEEEKKGLDKENKKDAIPDVIPIENDVP